MKKNNNKKLMGIALALLLILVVVFTANAGSFGGANFFKPFQKVNMISRALSSTKALSVTLSGPSKALSTTLTGTFREPTEMECLESIGWISESSGRLRNMEADAEICLDRYPFLAEVGSKPSKRTCLKRLRKVRVYMRSGRDLTPEMEACLMLQRHDGRWGIDIW